MKNTPLSRMRSARAMYEAHSGPNMTPMVDVVMVILIFFMASAVVLGPEWFVATRIPKQDAVAPQSQTPPPRIQLALSREADATIITLQGAGEPRRISLSNVTQALSEAIPADRQSDAVILVQAQPDVPYQDVVRIHAICTQAGYRKVGLGN